MKVDVQIFIVEKVERAKHSSSALTTNKYMQSHQNGKRFCLPYLYVTHISCKTIRDTK